MLQDRDLLSIQQARKCIAEALEAGRRLAGFSQEQVDAVVASMARAGEAEAGRLGEMAVRETGYGRVDHKTLKNLFASVDVHRYIRNLKTCGVVAENKEKKVLDIAVPVGLVAAVVPSTNPTSTAIFKLLCALKGRNPVVLSPHPRALACTVETARVLSRAAQEAGAPPGCIRWLEEVTMEGTSELMRHPSTALILATGGSGLVRAAYSSGKPAYGVGPGNVPAFIERTADVEKAVRDVLTGKTFDNGVLCSSEQSLVCDRPVEERVLEELEKGGAHFLSPQETERLNRLIRAPGGGLNPEIVGRSPQQIAEMAGFAVAEEVTCLVGRPGGVGRDHPLSMEKLSPILAFYVEDGWEAACERCIEILNYGGLGHTLAIHSRDEGIILEFGLHKPAYRICVNTPATLGAIGLTTGVPPSMTLGCGTPGGNITSDNITPLHLVNIKRVAFETRPFESIVYESPAIAPSESPRRRETSDAGQPEVGFRQEEVEEAVRGVVGDFFRKKASAAPQAERPPISEVSEPPREEPPLPLSAQPNRPEPSIGPVVDFVCEDDVRLALRERTKIAVNSGTILTPSARDLGEEKNVFVWKEDC